MYSRIKKICEIIEKKKNTYDTHINSLQSTIHIHTNQPSRPKNKMKTHTFTI